MIRFICEKLITLFSILQIFCLLFTVLYLFSWCIHVIVPDIYYMYIDNYLSYFPDFIDSIFYKEISFASVDISLGYIFASIICISIACLTTVINNYLDKLSDKKINIGKLYEMTHNVAEKKEKLYKKKAKTSEFYGLIEFKLKNINDFEKENKEILKEIKIEFSKMFTKKIKTKYQDIKFATNDKIFFECYSFSKINTLINDTVKVFKILYNIGKNKNIDVELIFSLWTNIEKNNPQEAFEILNCINKLNYTNKIITVESIKEIVQKLDKAYFDFIPIGTSQITVKNKDMDVELYYLKNMHKTI